MITDEQLSIVEDEYNKHLPTGFCDIDAMRKALEAYEQSKWVSVKNRLPEPDTIVLDQNCNKVKRGLACWYVSCINVHSNFLDESSIELDYWIPQYDGDEPHVVITHWQYLPEFKE